MKNISLPRLHDGFNDIIGGLCPTSAAMADLGGRGYSRLCPAQLSPIFGCFFLGQPPFPLMQWVTKRCCLSLLTNSALVFESKCEGRGWVAGSWSTAVHITWHGAQINFGDLPPYLTYASMRENFAYLILIPDGLNYRYIFHFTFQAKQVYQILIQNLSSSM